MISNENVLIPQKMKSTHLSCCIKLIVFKFVKCRFDHYARRFAGFEWLVFFSGFQEILRGFSLVSRRPNAPYIDEFFITELHMSDCVLRLMLIIKALVLVRYEMVIANSDPKRALVKKLSDITLGWSATRPCMSTCILTSFVYIFIEYLNLFSYIFISSKKRIFHQQF